MSGGPQLRSINLADSESKSVLLPGGNKVKLLESARKPAAKTGRKTEGKEVMTVEGQKDSSPADVESPALQSSLSAVAVLRRHEMLLRSNLSMNASCSSDTSTDSFCSRASTGRIGRMSSVNKRKQSYPKVGKGMPKLGKSVSDGAMMPMMPLAETALEKRRCSWVTANTEPCYTAFHDEEWGVPAHDDKKLFELLVLSGALAELTWPVILSKRHIFREFFLDFDPLAVSKLNDKKIALPGNTASSLLSEPKLRAVIENARQIVKIIDEYGSFDRYCWGFVNNKPLLSRFRYPRQVPVKTAKADLISKDLVRRGFRSVSPTVIYSFMQAAGLTNDHLINCFRFEDCIAAASSNSYDNINDSNHNIESTTVQDLDPTINLDLARTVDELRIL